MQSQIQQHATHQYANINVVASQKNNAIQNIYNIFLYKTLLELEKIFIRSKAHEMLSPAWLI